jgi:hypothetical protein
LEEERRETISELNESRENTAEPITLTVSRTYKASGEVVANDDWQETLIVREFLSTPARVGVDLSQTVNMGNFESVRVGVLLQIPCYAEEAGGAYEFASKFCKERVVAERDAAVDWAKKKGAGNLF